HRALLAALDQARAPEHGEMVGHGRARQFLGDCTIASEACSFGAEIVVEAANDRQPRRVGQSVKHARQGNVVQIRMNEAAHVADIETNFLILKFPLFGYLELSENPPICGRPSRSLPCPNHLPTRQPSSPAPRAVSAVRSPSVSLPTAPMSSSITTARPRTPTSWSPRSNRPAAPPKPSPPTSKMLNPSIA